MKTHRRPTPSGFTLVEMLVVMVIVVILAVACFLGTAHFIEKSKKVQAMAQFRDVDAGLMMFKTDYQRPPIPESKRPEGWDTIYGDAGGLYPNGFIVAVLMGDSSKDYPASSGETFKVSEVNPNMTNYMQFPYSTEKKKGVGPDGNLYDPWGGPVMIAVNGLKGTNHESMDDFNNGQNDARLHTWGMAEYSDGIMPRDQDWVMFSYGHDKVKSKGYKGSDDVVSWAQ